jgi:hypothetical protein
MIIPIHTTLPAWAASLIIDFPSDDIPVLSNEDDWKRWGNQLVQSSTFSQNGAPGTAGYNDWQKWAQAIFNTMSNY